MILHLAAVLAFALIGLSLGILGAGGAILTIPVCVYLLRMDAVDAISSSLFVVCTTSLAGLTRYLRQGLVDRRAVLYFGLPSVVSVWLFRRYALPAIPDAVGQVGDVVIDRSGALLVAFSLLVIFAGYKMIRKSPPPDFVRNGLPPKISFLLHGLLVGAITGLFGAGGGFLIVPTLVLLLEMDFKTAVGSSLCIISLNTAVGMLSHIELLHSVPWSDLLGFTAVALGFSLAGSHLAPRLPAQKLQPAFGCLLIAVAAFILYEQLASH
ncbi:MAG: sulfite exporter TauE/SafE family protein [Saprospiraceae bacterium]|nr:sulfite exporter TauE/SafE family protein [Saprospiraceae bacterium]MBV6474411.1 hypothetical protein [Saprospiraceae bacterium]